MQLYHAKLNQVAEDADEFTQPISVGSHILNLHFLWDTANDEQYVILQRALDFRAKSDPLIDGKGTITRDYDWIEYMLNLPIDIEAALDDGMEYPQSLRNVNNTIKANALQAYKEEAAELKLLVEPIYTQRCWHLDITDELGNVVTADVRPGGWINDQSHEWRIRFVTDLKSIGKDDLHLVQLEFEVDG